MLRNFILGVSFTIILTGCSSSINPVPSIHQQNFEDFSHKRPPRDNAFLAKGGYRDKLMLDPFSAEDAQLVHDESNNANKNKTLIDIIKARKIEREKEEQAKLQEVREPVKQPNNLDDLLDKEGQGSSYGYSHYDTARPIILDYDSWNRFEQQPTLDKLLQTVVNGTKNIIDRLLEYF